MAPEVGGAKADPADFPQLAVEVENEAAVGGVEGTRIKARSGVSIQLGAAEESAGVEFAAKQPPPCRQIDVELVLPRLRIASHADQDRGTLETLGMVIIKPRLEFE